LYGFDRTDRGDRSARKIRAGEYFLLPRRLLQHHWKSASLTIIHADLNAMTTAKHLVMEELEARLDEIRQAPKDCGAVRLIVRRMQEGEREVLKEAHLDTVDGLVGDSWKARGSKRTPDGSAHPELQITLMNVRVIAVLAPNQEHWPLAGDQLFIDLDLSAENVPPGTRLAIGSAVLEVTAPPHTGCKKFQARFGTEALKFISSPEGRSRQMRGIHAKVVQPGAVRVGDVAKKLQPGIEMGSEKARTAETTGEPARRATQG
jgi:hypothetical protein